MFGGKQATVMKVVSTPSQDLALTNCAYCSRADFSKYLLKGKDYGLGSINDNLVLKFQYPLIRMSQVSHEVWMLMLLFVSLGFGCTLQKRIDLRVLKTESEVVVAHSFELGSSTIVAF